MKNTKMLLAVAVSMTGLFISADDNNNYSYTVMSDKYSTIKFSTNDKSEDGNILHKFISHYGDENFEFIFEGNVKIFAMMKDAQNDIDFSDEETEKTKEDIRALLSGKDNNGRTPVELVRELKEANNDPIYDFIEVGLLALEDEVKILTPEQKQAKDLAKRNQAAAHKMFMAGLNRQ